MTSVPRKCKSSVCNRSAESLGFCSAHYKRFKKGLDTETPIQERRLRGESPKKCPGPGCTQDVRQNGLCQSHDVQMKKNGYLTAVMTRGGKARPRCEVSGCDREMETRRNTCRNHGRVLATYRMAVEKYNRLLKRGCQICGSLERLVLDHDHSCCSRETTGRFTCGGCLRGVLCDDCNRGLGLLGDSAESVARALTYLQRCDRIEDV